MSSDLCRIRMHVHKPHFRPDHPGIAVALGGDIGEPGAEHEQQVGVAQRRHLVGRIGEAHVACIIALVVVEQVLAAERDDGGELPFGEEGVHRLPASRPVEGAADDGDRPFGGGKRIARP